VDNRFALHAALFAACLLLVAMAAAGTAAFTYVNATRLRHLMQHGASRSQAVHEVTHHPGTVLFSLAFVHLLAVAGSTAIVFDYLAGSALDVPYRVALTVLTVFVVLIVQSFARGVGALRPEATAALLYRPVQLLALLATPIVRPGFALTEAVVRRVFGGASDDRAATSEEDLRVLVDAVEDTEALEENERDMITSIFEMSERDVVEIMVPRVDVVGLDGATTVANAIDLLVSSGHSRVPVYEGDLDHLLGMVHLRDLVGALRAGRANEPIGPLARAVHVVPETKKIDELLEEFQKERIQFAVVVDEYGGTAGIVTIEDLLEEIVGEIHDEYDVVAAPIEVVSEREAIMDASVSIHDVNKTLGLDLDDRDYDTIGGLVYERLGKVPVPGDVVDLGRATIGVISTTGRRVQRVRVTLDEPPQSER
jgi:CBS domain containing-hemolysin-like protein